MVYYPVPYQNGDPAREIYIPITAQSCQAPQGRNTGPFSVHESGSVLLAASEFVASRGRLTGLLERRQLG